MKHKFYQTQEFRELSWAWDKKLYRAGFNDIEALGASGERVLKQYTCVSKSGREQDTRSKAQYYSILYNCVCTQEIEKPLDKLIMTKFSEGSLIREIVDILSAQGTPTHRQTIRYIIRRYEHTWGLKYWSLRERNLKYE